VCERERDNTRMHEREREGERDEAFMCVRVVTEKQ